MSGGAFEAPPKNYKLKMSIRVPKGFFDKISNGHHQRKGKKMSEP
jgi:hypothetical protein